MKVHAARVQLLFAVFTEGRCTRAQAQLIPLSLNQLQADRRHNDTHQLIIDQSLTVITLLLNINPLTDEPLLVRTVTKQACDFAFTFKISFQGTKLKQYLEFAQKLHYETTKPRRQMEQK